MNSNARHAEMAELFARLTVLMTAQPAADNVPAPRSMPDRVLLTVEEAAQRIGIGKTKAYELVKSGDLESVQIGRLRRIHVDAIKAYAARLVAEQSNSRNAA